MVAPQRQDGKRDLALSHERERILLIITAPHPLPSSQKEYQMRLMARMKYPDA